MRATHMRESVCQARLVPTGTPCQEGGGGGRLSPWLHMQGHRATVTRAPDGEMLAPGSHSIPHEGERPSSPPGTNSSAGNPTSSLLHTPTRQARPNVHLEAEPGCGSFCSSSSRPAAAPHATNMSGAAEAQEQRASSGGAQQHAHTTCTQERAGPPTSAYGGAATHGSAAAVAGTCSMTNSHTMSLQRLLRAAYAAPLHTHVELQDCLLSRQMATERCVETSREC